MGACFDRLRCEVFQNLFLSPMNTGFVRPAVATVLTACGIETEFDNVVKKANAIMLQQYLPLAVLKPLFIFYGGITMLNVATVLTACGIETRDYDAISYNVLKLQQYLPLAVLKLANSFYYTNFNSHFVATVLTACGIETLNDYF